MPHLDRPIPYLPIDVPIPFRPKRRHTVSTGSPKTEKQRNSELATLADNLARYTEARDAIETDIAHVKGRILELMGPLTEAHTALIGYKADWDIRQLPTTTVAWRKVAEALNASRADIAMHSVTRTQLSFKRVPKEVGK